MNAQPRKNAQVFFLNQFSVVFPAVGTASSVTRLLHVQVEREHQRARGVLLNIYMEAGVHVCSKPTHKTLLRGLEISKRHISGFPQEHNRIHRRVRNADAHAVLLSVHQYALLETAWNKAILRACDIIHAQTQELFPDLFPAKIQECLKKHGGVMFIMVQRGK